MMTKRARWATLACIAALLALLAPAIASAQTGVMFVKNNRVGIGTDNPTQKLAIFGSASSSALVQARATDTTAALRTLFQITNVGPPSFTLQDAGPGGTAWFLAMTGAGGGNGLAFTSLGQTQGTPFRLNLNGNLTIAGTLSQGSSRTIKENIEPVDPAEVLSTVVGLPVARWSYKSDPARHLGPMAEDFHRAFGLGLDETKISTLDTSGIAIAAVQGLHAVVQQKDAEIAELTSRLENLERLVAELANK